MVEGSDLAYLLLCVASMGLGARVFAWWHLTIVVAELVVFVVNHCVGRSLLFVRYNSPVAMQGRARIYEIQKQSVDGGLCTHPNLRWTNYGVD